MNLIRGYPGEVEGLAVEHRDGCLDICLDRPERRNAITDDMVMALIDLIDTAGSDESVRVIHLSGTGEHFSSGFDLSLRGGDGPRPRLGTTQRQMRWHVNRLIPTMLETQTPIVVSVKGWAIGLAMNLVLASDFAIVADDARLWAPFTGAGFTPDSGASWLLPRLVGLARAKDLVMLGRKLDGYEAAEWGLVHRSVPVEQVDHVAGELLEQLAGSATVALGLAKLLLHRSLTVDLERHLADEGFAMELSSRSDDFAEASRAGREKRRPDFTGR